MQTEKIFAKAWSDYELLDAGGGKKLERWGKIITIRPEVQAYFRSGWGFQKWYELAHWEFLAPKGKKGNWKQLNSNAPTSWTIKYKRLQFHLELTKFKHLGLFPEQVVNWELIHRHLQTENTFLNLFAYTGAASLVARNKAAITTHVDAVKPIISWARKNMKASKLLNIRWVHEDALKFAKREVKRGNTYKGLLMDPPAWGRGAKGEQWKLEEKLDELLAVARDLMEKDGFAIVNTYSPKITAKDLKQLASLYFEQSPFKVVELWMKSKTEKELFFGNTLYVGDVLLSTSL